MIAMAMMVWRSDLGMMNAGFASKVILATALPPVVRMWLCPSVRRSSHLGYGFAASCEICFPCLYHFVAVGHLSLRKGRSPKLK